MLGIPDTHHVRPGVGPSEDWGFPPPCYEPRYPDQPLAGLTEGRCSGQWMTNITITDRLRVPADLPPHPGIDSSVPHAPRRPVTLSPAERELALRNALRYFPEGQHATLMPEFVQELDTLGHIYCHRLRPLGYAMKAHPLAAYPCKTRQARLLA